MLLRIPMLSEIEDVLQYADISLQSELTVIQAIQQLAKQQNKAHDIIIMFDLGDLREGIYYKDDYIPIIKQIQKLLWWSGPKSRNFTSFDRNQT